MRIRLKELACVFLMAISGIFGLRSGYEQGSVLGVRELKHGCVGVLVRKAYIVVSNLDGATLGIC